MDLIHFRQCFFDGDGPMEREDGLLSLIVGVSTINLLNEQPDRSSGTINVSNSV
jgi:hypothetical protein